MQDTVDTEKTEGPVPDALQEEQLREAFGTVVEAVMPTIVHVLLQQGKLDIERCKNTGYVWSVVLENLKVIDKLRMKYVIDDQFKESACEAVKLDRYAVAVVLIATVIEHKLNSFYRDILESQTDLSNEDIIDAIRSSVYTKLGWLMPLVTNHDISDELKSRIKRLADLRNALVHYKSPVIPMSQDDNARTPLEQEIKTFGLENMLGLPDELVT